MRCGTEIIEAAFTGVLGTFYLDIAFKAPMQGITALFGPSGCGKTTILRCIAGLNHLPGRLSTGGESWQDDEKGVFRKPHERPIGYVFQEASLFPHLSVRKNLLYGTERAKKAQTTDAFKFNDIVELLGIGHLLDRAPANLSGGERQRVAIGRALLSQPQLLLMDEPFAALDRATKDEILPYLEVVHETLSIPILYVSHDIAEVARLADHVIVLSTGRKVADGPVQEILERLDLQPETGRFEAGIVLTARVTGHDNEVKVTRLEHHGQTITIPFANIPLGQQVRLRIRARDVALATHRPEGVSIRNILAGTISEIVEEPETAFAEILIDVGGGRLRARITREAVMELALQSGKPVFALIKSISFDRRALVSSTMASVS